MNANPKKGREMRNTQLVEYGVADEQVDWHVHVCFCVKYVYVIPMDWLKSVVFEEGNDLMKTDVVNDDLSIVTAKGFLLPVDMLDSSSQMYRIPDELLEKYHVTKEGSSEKKGKMAMNVVCSLLRSGIIPFKTGTPPFEWPSTISDDDIRVVSDKQLQLRGIDLILRNSLSFQVKCDFAGGHEMFGGTGNLFIQTAECNPYQER